MSDINADWLKWPLDCCATAVRDGHEHPCGKPAIAVGMYDGEEFEPHNFPVCGHHARGRKVMPLVEIIRTIKNEVYRRSAFSLVQEMGGTDGGYRDGMEAALRIIEKETR